jgi:hypothetical protein
MAKPRFGRKSGSAGRRKKKGPIGKVSRSQTVTTYGPGSLYELRTFKGGAIANSVIVAGTHLWPVDEMQEVSEPTLAASLGVDRLLMPPSAEDDDNPVPVPAYRFPEWLECNECHRIGHVNIHFDEEIDAPPKCSANDCNGYGVPTRLVVACHAGDKDTSGKSPGHIDNFPWTWWAHSQAGGNQCENSEIYLQAKGKKAGISGLMVECRAKGCGASRSLEGVFNKDALMSRGCSGYRPWLGSRKEDGVCEPCERPVRALLRGASNIYFPVPASAISIPPLSYKLVQEIVVRGRVILNSLKQDQADGKTIDREMYINLFQNGIPSFRRYDRDQIGMAMDILLENAAAGGQKLTEAQQKDRERQALTHDSDENQIENDFENKVVEDYELQKARLLKNYLEILAKVHRLREVRALRGFQRIESSPVADSYTQACAPLSKFPEDWLPAIETRGEGIYFELSKDRLAEWETHTAVTGHIRPLVDHFERYCEERKIDPDMDLVAPGYLMIHTLSHLLIKQLSLECGYSSASIRERLFYGRNEDEQWCGVLLYTASGSADGTLGGLVRQGEPANLDAMMASSLENARWCSSDPLCIESEGQGVDALNMAACHACALVSETSCEQRNLLLDRALLVGTPENPEIGFFHEFLHGDRR